MTILFTKETHKPSTLSCQRADGSRTFTKLNPAIEIHDLAHYVVEVELGFNNAFYGLLAQGYDIQDFELPIEERPEELIPVNLSDEALQTEHIVNLLQVHLSEQDGNFDVLASLKIILKENNLPFPELLTQEKLDGIFKKLRMLYARWMDLGQGDALELTF